MTYHRGNSELCVFDRVELAGRRLPEQRDNGAIDTGDTGVSSNHTRSAITELYRL